MSKVSSGKLWGVRARRTAYLAMLLMAAVWCGATLRGLPTAEAEVHQSPPTQGVPQRWSSFGNRFAREFRDAETNGFAARTYRKSSRCCSEQTNFPLIVVVNSYTNPTRERGT